MEKTEDSFKVKTKVLFRPRGRCKLKHICKVFFGKGHIEEGFGKGCSEKGYRCKIVQHKGR